MLKLNTDNFHLHEWATNKYGMVYPNPEKIILFEGLETYKQFVAEFYNVNIKDVICIITSGDRLPKNDSINSQHEHGRAADIYTKIPKLNKILTTQEQMRIIESINYFTGRGMYLAKSDDGIIHVDIRRGLKPEETGERISRWYRDVKGKYHTCKDKTYCGILKEVI